MTARDVCFSVQPLQGLSGTKRLLFTVFGGKWLFFTSFGGKWLLFTVFFKKGYTKIRVLKKRESRTNFLKIFLNPDLHSLAKKNARSLINIFRCPQTARLRKRDSVTD